MESSNGANIMEISSFVPVTFQEGERETGLDLKKTDHCSRARDGRSLRETMGPVLLQMLRFLEWYSIIVMNRGSFLSIMGLSGVNIYFSVCFSVAC